MFRGEADEEGDFYEYHVPAGEGMVVLDAIHWIQQNVQPDLAARWNCKAAKCGSCCAEINGKPSLMCKTRLSDFPDDEAITVEPDARLPAHPRPGHRRVLELPDQCTHHALHAACGRAPE